MMERIEQHRAEFPGSHNQYASIAGTQVVDGDVWLVLDRPRLALIWSLLAWLTVNSPTTRGS